MRRRETPSHTTSNTKKVPHSTAHQNGTKIVEKEEVEEDVVESVKTNSTEEVTSPSLSNMEFLQKLVHYMLQNGYSVMKLEKQITRLSLLLQVQVEETYFDIQQYRLHLSYNGQSKQFIQNTPNMGCNVTKLYQLENWIEKFEANPKLLSEFQKQFVSWNQVSSSPNSNYDWVSIMARTVGASGFAILLSGNVYDLCTVVVTSILVGMASYWNLSYFLTSVNLITGFVSLFLIRFFHWPLDLSLIFLATSSNYLPGLSIFYGVWEVMSGKINMGTSRIVNAIVSGGQIALGIAVTYAFKNANLEAYQTVLQSHYSTSWPFFLSVAVMLVTVYILCMAFQVPIQRDEYTLLFIQAVCFATNLFNTLFGMLGLPSLVVTFLNALIYGLSSKCINWLPKSPSKKVKKRYPIAFKIVTVILMVPGSNLIKCFEWIALGKPELAFQSVLEAILTCITIVLAFTASDTIGMTLSLPHSLCDL